jgi:hypothetical protein
MASAFRQGPFYFTMKFAFLPLAFLLASCSPKPAADNSSTTMTETPSNDSINPISVVIARHTPDWMNTPGVTGTGETQKDGKPAILILVDSLTGNMRTQFPASVDGYPVVIKATGTIKAR